MPRVRLLGWFWWAPIFYAEISTSLSLCERTDDNETEGEGERSLVRFGDKWVSGIVIGNSFIFASHQSERQRLLQTRKRQRRKEKRGSAGSNDGSGTQVTKFNDTAGQTGAQNNNSLAHISSIFPGKKRTTCQRGNFQVNEYLNELAS